jgi:hypothetical protein
MKIIEHSLFRKAWHRTTIHNDSQLLSHYSNISEISSVYLAVVLPDMVDKMMYQHG